VYHKYFTKGLLHWPPAPCSGHSAGASTQLQTESS